MKSRITHTTNEVVEWLNAGELLWPVDFRYVQHITRSQKILPTPKCRHYGFRFSAAARRKLRDVILARQNARLTTSKSSLREVVAPDSKAKALTPAQVRKIRRFVLQGVISSAGQRTRGAK